MKMVRVADNKRILRNMAGTLACVIVGFGLVWLIATAVNHDETDVPVEKEVGRMAVVGKIVLAILFSVGCGIIHVLLHEVGHLLCGLATGYRMLSFRIFKYTWVHDKMGYHWKQYHVAGTLGQCIMVPMDQITDKSIPYFWYNFGGVLMNLIVAALSGVLLYAVEPGAVGRIFLLMMVCMGLLFAGMNGFPWTMNGVNNDGRTILVLARKPEMRLYFLNIMRIVGEQSNGRRLVEMPQEWFNDQPLSGVTDYFMTLNRMIYMSLQEDMGRLERAREIAEEIMAFGRMLPPILVMEVGAERVMLELMTSNRKDVVDSLWTEPLQTYTTTNCKYSPIKMAVLYAVELIHHHDKAKAETYRQALEGKMDEFAMPGEAGTALYLINLVACKERKNEGAFIGS
ncbi:MAG: hypothetical protein ACI30I_02930 [Parabacteroides sp.]